MAEAIMKTNFNFAKQKGLYVGKVRDVYNIDDKFLVMVVSDRISCFDIVLPKGIPYKGQVLNQIASKFLDATADIVPNWKIESPDPMVTIGHFAKPFKVEAFNEYRQWSLPRFLSMVIQFAKFLRIHPEFTSHLNVSMGKLMSCPSINPYLILRR